MLAAQSLGKRPVKAPNWKPWRLVLPPSYKHVNRFPLKCTLLKVDLLQDNQLFCLEACMCALPSPEIVQAVVVKGLTNSPPLPKNQMARELTRPWAKGGGCDGDGRRREAARTRNLEIVSSLLAPFEDTTLIKSEYNWRNAAKRSDIRV